MKTALKWAAVAALGAGAGYAWWYFFGCSTGCAITSSPLNSSLYGMGIALLFRWGSK